VTSDYRSPITALQVRPDQSGEVFRAAFAFDVPIDVVSLSGRLEGVVGGDPPVLAGHAIGVSVPQQSEVQRVGREDYRVNSGEIYTARLSLNRQHSCFWRWAVWYWCGGENVGCASNSNRERVRP